MSKSNKSRAVRKPKKPYADFPLTPHASGKWMKKIRGKIHYFGAWARRLEGVLIPVENDGWKEALDEYKAVADDLHAGRAPRAQTDELQLKELCNRFLTAKTRKVEAGEMSSGLFYDYKVITDLLVSQFGANRLVDDLAPDDFAALRVHMARKWGPVRLLNSITRIKSIFKFGFEAGLLDRPVRYGPEFVKPDQAVMRKHRAKAGPKLFTAEEVRALLGRADATMRAAILLGVNCGFGAADVAELPTGAVDLDAGWINFPRPKTGIARRCPLWPETVEALRAAEAVRAKPFAARDVGRMLLSETGSMLVTRSTRGHTKDLIGARFTYTLKALGLYRKQLGHYALRHVFETIAGGTKDQVAVDLVMGHSDPSMGAVYREGVEDARLRAVADHVRKWLFEGQDVKPVE